MVIEPHDKQHPTVKKLGLNVKRLEEVTMEAMANWFNDRERPDNASKKHSLKRSSRLRKRRKDTNVARLVCQKDGFN
jgi:hypothetical protein